jgi:hypothetical protein
MIKEIHIKVIPHNEQREHGNVGDYWEKSPGVWEMRVSELGDWRKNMLVAVHELAEVIQTEAAGIPEPTIQKFDEEYYRDNPDTLVEAGDVPAAPYHRQHVVAELIERLLASQLGISWLDHTNAVESL